MNRSPSLGIAVTCVVASAISARAAKRVQFGYGLNYLIDIGPAAVIVGVEATPARTYDEVAATKVPLCR